MLYRLAADAVVLVHVAFILFVIAGGLLALRWRWVAYVHIPVAMYGVAIEFGGWICPLTPLEVHLRRLAGEAGYAGGFIDHYIVRIIYPPGLTPGVQIALGVAVLVLNVAIYSRCFARRREPRVRHSL